MCSRISNRLLSSPNSFCQILGAFIKPSALAKTGWLIVIGFGILLMLQAYWKLIDTPTELYYLGCITVLTIFIISTCITLTDVYSLLKKEEALTRCQITILFAIGLWIIGFLLIFDINQNKSYYLALLIIGSMLGWIYKDTLKGITAFVHLRINHLLKIGDWIQVPKYNVDGEIRRVTLTTVTIYNWDTTTSSLPTSVLLTDHFINVQRMAEGKTYGRQMIKTFSINNKFIHPISLKDAEDIRKRLVLGDGPHYLQDNEVREGVLNIQLFRLYIYHWLMSHPDVSHKPWVLARWMDPDEHGTPLQIYIYLKKYDLPEFEWSQSQIIEHIITSLDWFGLQLFQSRSEVRETSEEKKEGSV
ncbi:MAG: mechanosensitive ion channel [Bacteroidaceae bacterium]|nr:mechanosensitive ion channel [Bacteroidaceae bacterium]